MYEVGEFIVHPGQGVCRVDEVVNEPQPTYLLMPVGMRHPMRISYPVSGEGRLRSVVEPERARALIEEYDSMEPERFTAKSGALEEEHFKNQIRNGTCEDSVRIVKTFRMRIAEIRSRNKRPPVAYERILKLASQRSLTELATALDLSTEDVVALFEAQGSDFQAEN